MANAENTDIAHDFLGSAHVFASAVEEVVEKRLLEEIAGKHLTLSQFKLIKMVAMTDARTITDVALFLGVSNAAASKAVDKLVRRKLLRRAEGQPDRREIRLSLTESSRRLLAAYEEKKERKLAELFHGFPEDELRRTARLLDRLSAGLVDHHAGPDETCLQCGIYFRDDCLVRRLVGRHCFYAPGREHRQHVGLLAGALPHE
jgi:MarR family transcriptional regulator, temperature-dependent positive regulator of motility